MSDWLLARDVETYLAKAQDAEARGEYDVAARHVANVIAILRRAPTPPIAVIELTEQLAYYAVARGQYQEAVRLYQDVLTERERQLGLSHPDLASTVMALGSAHANLWELDSAESAYFRAALLAMDGPESVRLELAHKVAALHLRQGKASEVIGECRHALAAVDRADPSYSTVVADLEHDLALALTEMGQLEEAERLYVRLVAATDEQPRRAAPQIVLLLLNYGHLLVDQEKFADAYIVLERALSMAESVLGTEHPNTAYALHSIGALYMRQGAYVLAEEYLRRAIAIWDSLDEGLSPIAAESLHALALLRGHKWDFVEAERLLERALAIQLAALPETDARVLATQEALASVPGRNQSRHGQETEVTE